MRRKDQKLFIAVAEMITALHEMDKCCPTNSDVTVKHMYIAIEKMGTVLLNIIEKLPEEGEDDVSVSIHHIFRDLLDPGQDRNA